MDAEQLLNTVYGWSPYKYKHYESRFTKFLEGFWLPSRFEFDVRRVQLSSLILTEQMSRSNALTVLRSPAISEDEITKELNFVANKLEVSGDELWGFLESPKKFYWNYRNQKAVFDLGAKTLSFFNAESVVKR